MSSFFDDNGNATTPEEFADRDDGPSDFLSPPPVGARPGPSAEVVTQVSNDLMNDAAFRIDVAMLYRNVLKTPLFDENERSPAVEAVENAIHEFCRQEMEILLGMRTRQSVADFTPAQVEFLKQLADRGIQRPASAQRTEGTKVTLPGLPQVPTVRRVSTQTAAPSPPAPPAPKPAAAPATTSPPPAAKPQAPAKPQPKAGTQKTGKRQRRETTAEDDKGNTIKVVETEDGRKLKEIRDPSGNIIAQNDHTPQVRSPSALPMPNPAQMQAVLERNATLQVAAAGATVTKESPNT